MFGLPPETFINPDGDGAHTGDQIRGFGYTHSGGFPSVFLFISELGFVFVGIDRDLDGRLNGNE